MKRISHNKKIKMARRMITSYELKDNCSIFNSREWLKRHEERHNRHLRNNIPKNEKLLGKIL
jgi:hypothetical protein